MYHITHVKYKKNINKDKMVIVVTYIFESEDEMQ